MLSPAEDDPHNTGGGTLCRGRGQPVPTTTLEKVLARADGQVRMMKLDCEGSEYSILDDVDLTAVKELCGEAHDITVRGRRQGISDVVASLRSHPSIDHFKTGPTTWLFYAAK